MTAIQRLQLVIAIAALGTAAAPVCAEPASSPQSAWTNLTLRPDPTLKDPIARRGKEVFQARCAACHGAYEKSTDTAASNPGGMSAMPGTAALAAKYKGAKPAELEQRTDLTAEFVSLLVRRGVGFMPPFRPTEVSDEDLKAVSVYLARKHS